jgi:hypothetical protein
MDRRRDDDIAALGADIEPRPHLLGIAADDRSAIEVRELEEEMSAAAARDRLDRGRQWLLHFVLDVAKGGFAVFAFGLIDVDVDNKHAGRGACGNADVGVAPALPPGIDLLGIFAGVPKTVSGERGLPARRDGKHRHSPLGQREGGSFELVAHVWTNRSTASRTAALNLSATSGSVSWQMLT